MPETPDTPAVREKREAETKTLTRLLYAAQHESGDYDLHAAAYRDAVAARVTAELLASGTPLHVATDGGPDSDPLFRMSAVFQREPQRLPSGDWHDSGD